MRSWNEFIEGELQISRGERNMGLKLYVDNFSTKEVTNIINNVFQEYPRTNIILVSNLGQVEVTKEDSNITQIERICNKNNYEKRFDLNIETFKLKEHFRDEFNPYEYDYYNTSKEGVQDKLLNKNNDIIKVDTYIKEGLHEVLAYEISKHIKEIEIVEYKPCIIDNGKEFKTGCVSTNINRYGITNIIDLKTLVSKDWTNLSRQDCIKCLSDFVNIQKLFQLLAFDVLICNTDRHLGNIWVRDEVLSEIQLDNGRAFASSIDCNIFDESMEYIANNCVYQPFNYTVGSFLTDFKMLNIEPLTIDIEGLNKTLSEYRNIMYSTKLINKKIELFKYQLELTKGILWKEG